MTGALPASAGAGDDGSPAHQPALSVPRTRAAPRQWPRPAARSGDPPRCGASAQPRAGTGRGWREGGEGRGALPAAPGPLFPAVLSGGTVPAAFDGALGVEGCIMYNKAELTK